MKKLFNRAWAVVAMAAMTMTAYAGNYALLGDVPEGYTDLTANVEVSTTINGAGDGINAADYADASSFTVTGKGLGGNYVCHQNVAVSVRFKADQTLTLTDKMAIHMVVKRLDEGTGVLETSMTQGNWGGSGSRLSYEIAADKISAEAQEIVLNYADVSKKGVYSTYNEQKFVGEKNYPGGEGKEIFRFNAVAGEQFEITQIYIEGEAGSKPGPGPEPDPEEKSANKRYYLFRNGDLPESDSIAMVDLREGEGTTMQLNSMTKGEETEYIHYGLSNSWFSFNQNLKAATDMSDVKVDSWSLVVKMRTNVTNNSFNLRLNNAGECWQLKGGNLPLKHDGTWEELVLPLSSSAKTLNFTASMTGTIFQMHAEGAAEDQYIDIEYAYITNDATIPEDLQPIVPDEDAPTAVAASATETTDESITLSLYAEDAISATIYYAITYGETTLNTNGKAGETTTFTVTGLSADTDYSLSIVASDKAGNAATAVTVTAKTKAEVQPEPQDDMVIIIRKGTLSVASSVVVADYSAVIYGDAWENAMVQYYPDGSIGVISAAWWYKYFINVGESADLSDVNKNWQLIIRLKSEVSNPMSFELAGQAIGDVTPTTDYADYVLPLSAILDKDNTLKTVEPGKDILAFSAGNDQGAHEVHFDYIYLKNFDGELPTGVENVDVDANVNVNANKILVNGEIIIVRDGQSYNVMGQKR